MIQTTQGLKIEKPAVEGKVRVYYIDGTSHDCWPVDAAEMVAAGSYFYERPAVEVKADDKRIVVDEDEADSEAEEAEEIGTVEKPKRSRKAK